MNSLTGQKGEHHLSPFGCGSARDSTSAIRFDSIQLLCFQSKIANSFRFIVDLFDLSVSWSVGRSVTLGRLVAFLYTLKLYKESATAEEKSKAGRRGGGGGGGARRGRATNQN